MDELERKNLRAMIERHKDCGRWCKVAKQYWHDNVSVETATAVANQHALLTRECEFVTAAEQVGVNLPALLADSERLALRDELHCPVDCLGWQAAIDKFRSSHGTRTPVEFIEEFEAAEEAIRALLSMRLKSKAD